MIVAVAGGRDFNDPAFVSRILWGFHSSNGITEMHEGGAKGWDSWCRQWARNQGIQVITYWANWEKHGKAAGHMRNGLILERAKPECLIAGPGGRGTANMVMQATKLGIRIYDAAKQLNYLKAN